MEIKKQKPEHIYLNEKIKEEMDDSLETVEEKPIGKEFSEQVVPKFEEIIEPLTPEKTIQLVHSSVLKEKKQKPKDLLEKEIKEESEYFFEEVKEEPLDREYFEQIVPKLEIDEPCSTSTSQMTHFVQQDLQNVKQETDDVFKNFKEEPKEEFSQLIVPKLEEVVEASTSEEAYQLGHWSVLEQEEHKPIDLFKEKIREENDGCLFDDEHNPVLIPTESISSSSNQKLFQSALIRDDVKLEPIDDVIENSHERNMLVDNVARRNTGHLDKNADFKLCQMCSVKKHRGDMKYVTMEEDKFIIMIGYLLRNDCTLDQAKRFMSRKFTYMCHAHFSDANDTICEALQIKLFDEIDSSSDVLMQNLMITVNTLRSQITFWEFREIFQKFIVKNLEKRMNVRTRTPVQKPCNHRCSVCSQTLLSNRMKSVTLENDKLIIIIGSALRGACDPERAQLFVSKNNRIFICHEHFSEAVNEIYKRLDIQTPGRIYSCSAELMQNLMDTVDSICPQVDKSQFCEILNEFVLRNIIRKRNRPITENDQNQKKYPDKKRCEICKHMRIQSYSKQVTLEDEKLIIMIGYILHGDYTIEEAKRFITEKRGVYICHDHLVEVNNEIYKALQITKPEEIFYCSSELIENMMITVNAIVPGIIISAFQNFLHKFAVRNKKYISISD